MATAAAIAAAAAVTASAAASGYQASQAGKGGGGEPQFKQVPKRPFETAGQKYMQRVLLANIDNKGPSWEEFLGSGGQARFELQNTGMTPMEAEKMGFVGRGGRPREFYDPTTEGGLTREQWEDMRREAGPESPLGQRHTRLNQMGRRIARMETRLSEGKIPEKRVARIQERVGRLKEKREKLRWKGYRGGE